LVPAETVGEAVVTHPPRTLVLKSGRVLYPGATTPIERGQDLVNDDGVLADT
jgi:hypothetical protein